MIDGRRGPRLRVVVIGASLAGLFTAAAAAQAGHQVTVLERDRLVDSPGPRDGVPQGRQPHVFLLRGLLAAQELLPGLRQELQARGAVRLDTGLLAWRGEQGWSPIRPTELDVVSLTRPWFEQVVRRRVAALAGVELRGDCHVRGLRRVGSGPTASWHLLVAAGSAVPADLVVDASGRSSRLAHWLSQIGVEAPAVSEVDARIGYATREYRGGPDLRGLSGVVLQCTPDSQTGGLVLPVEDDRWLVLALGSGEHRPPRDVPGFEDFLRRLPDPAVADFTRRCRGAGEVIVHRQTGNRRHHYERARDWPAGLLAVGDAFVSFNPVFGQGITVAACEALVVRDALLAGRLPSQARRVMAELARTAALPWRIAVGQDVRQPTTEARENLVQRVSNGWARELSRLAIHGNDRALSTMMRMYHLVGTPASLLHPALIGAVMWTRVVGSGPATGRPDALASLAPD